MSIDRGVDKEDGVHIYSGILLSHKKNETLSFTATWMDLEITLSEVSQKEKDKYYMISLICRIIKIKQMNLFTKQKQTHIEHKLMVTKEKRGGD